MPNSIEPIMVVATPNKWDKFKEFLQNRKFLLLFSSFLIVIVLLMLKFWSNSSNKKPVPTPLILDNTLVCPTTKDFCTSGKPVIKNNEYVGMGSTDIKKDSLIYAVFDGQVMTSQMIGPTGENFTVLYLLGSKPPKEVAYWFKGTATKAALVKKGDVIATTSAQALNDYQNTKFIFTVMDANGKAVELKPGDFK